MKKPIGKISHYFSKINVAIVELEETLKIGEKILIEGPETAFEQEVESIQIEREPVQEAGEGQSIGLKTIKPVKEGFLVYKAD